MVILSTTLFKKVDYSLSKLIHDIDHGDIGLPDIQRPFVWKASKVRDLFDSMYRGFPVGYFLFWSNEHMASGEGSKQIGAETKQVNIPKLLIVDGQQRLTSLYAVIKGKEIITHDYKKTRIKIAFRPLDEHFEVSDAAIAKDINYIDDISKLWQDNISLYKFIKDFIKKVRDSRPEGLTDDEEEKISDAITKLYNIQNYQFTAMEISSTVDEEEVSEIFVRINSKGKPLNQADFILTLLSVFWDEGRKELEEFSRNTRIPKDDGTPSSYNYFIKTEPDQLLRVCVGYGFRRARLQYVYSILRGKDLETGQYSDELRGKQFEILKASQKEVLNLQNWHDFLKVLVSAGFRSGNMIGSKMNVLYSYVMYLIGKKGCNVDAFTLRRLIAKWYFMANITGRYTSSPETIMEGDLARLRGINDSDQFIEVLEKIIDDSLTADFWDITLVNNLETSSSRSPALYAYYAALNLLNANVLFSNMKVSELLDPNTHAYRKSIEKHHLFPKEYLKSIGIKETKTINQVANYALVEWEDNNTISKKPPEEYFPQYVSRFSHEELHKMMYWHGLYDGWQNDNYYDFLEKRRKKMAKVIKEGFLAI